MYLRECAEIMKGGDAHGFSKVYWKLLGLALGQDYAKGMRGSLGPPGGQGEGQLTDSLSSNMFHFHPAAGPQFLRGGCLG